MKETVFVREKEVLILNVTEFSAIADKGLTYFFSIAY